MNKAYEISLWDKICMPGREMGVVVTEHLPKEGEVLNGARIKHIWRTGAKIESPERYTAIVE